MFREIYVATPAEVCESRDPKGHYAKARAGALQAFTGIGNDYQPPSASELTIDTSTRSVADATDDIERMLVDVRHSVRRTGRPRCQYLSQRSGHCLRNTWPAKAFSRPRLWR